MRDEAELLRDIRRELLRASREKQKETRERRERERAERAANWKTRQAREITYLGPGVSAGLNHVESDEAKLRDAGLPQLGDAASIAAAMGIRVGELRFLAFSRDVSRVSHYETFRVAKKSGGTRTIRAPRPRLKAAQRWILEHVLDRVPVHEAAHGFRRGRSVRTNAEPHVNQAIVVNLDLADFFPTVRYPRVKGMFQWL
ncbi:MAG TPA: RNA-dependent DNA polymerase, partial [Planctomycetes bacterium]|nr:RNA-dependent DNA polymerase [Planctomycetota bacterium]